MSRIYLKHGWVTLWGQGAGCGRLHKADDTMFCSHNEAHISFWGPQNRYSYNIPDERAVHFNTVSLLVLLLGNAPWIYQAMPPFHITSVPVHAYCWYNKIMAGYGFAVGELMWPCGFGFPFRCINRELSASVGRCLSCDAAEHPLGTPELTRKQCRQ